MKRKMMDEQKQKSGKNSTNTQVGGNQYTANHGASIHVQERDDEKRIEFIKEVLSGILITILATVAFITNPSAEDHVNKIARGAFVNYQLDKEFFYKNNFLFSEIYVIGGDDQEIRFSWGLFGQIFETSSYQYNQRKFNK